MVLFTWPIAATALVLCFGGGASGQCNPSLGSCATIPGFSTGNYFIDFTQHSATPSDWVQASYETVDYGSNGAEFSLAQKGDAPYIWTNAYFLFGRVDVVMQAAPGIGVISSAVLMSDDLDEIDWEFSGNNFGLSGGHVQTNYFGKGITGNYDRGTQPSVSDPTKAFHTYSLDWSASKLVWSVDGTVLRTLSYSPATSGAYQYPQTPMRLHLGLWDAGDPNESQGVVQWAGGYTNLTELPYTAYVRSVKITPSSPCSSYVYSDKSGSYQSIQCLNDTLPPTSSSVFSALLSPTTTSFPIASSATSPTVIVPASSSATSTSTSTSTSMTTSISMSGATSLSTTTSMNANQSSGPVTRSTASGASLFPSTATSATSTIATPVSPASSTSSVSATSTVSESSSNSFSVTISSSSIAPGDAPNDTPEPIPTSSSSPVAVTTSSASTSSTTPSSAPMVIPTPTQSLSLIPKTTLTLPPTTPKPALTPTQMKCNQDNCLRNMLDSRYASSVTRFCSGWLATATAPSEIPQVPPFVSGGCKNDFSRVSSACKCVPTPTAMATLTSGAKKRSEKLARAFGRQVRQRRRYVYAYGRQEEGQMLPNDTI